MLKITNEWGEQVLEKWDWEYQEGNKLLKLKLDENERRKDCRVWAKEHKSIKH